MKQCPQCGIYFEDDEGNTCQGCLREYCDICFKKHVCDDPPLFQEELPPDETGLSDEDQGMLEDLDPEIEE